MSQTEALIRRIHALAEKTNRKPSTLSRELLGNGMRLSELENGSTITLDTYARVEKQLTDMERKAA